MLTHDKGNCQMVVDQIRYFGFIVPKSGKLKFGIEDVATAGLKAKTNLFRMFRNNLFLLKWKLLSFEIEFVKGMHLF